MFDQNGYNPSSEPVQEPAQTPDSLFAQSTPQQPASGSYYSPRSGGSSGGYVPPTGGVPPMGDEPPKKRSHKGLRALAVFASIAFLSYASIQCYQFATQNENIRKFFGKDSMAEETLDLQSSTKSEESEGGASVKEVANTDGSSGGPITAENWIQAAARTDALSIPDIVDKVTPATVGVASTFSYTQPGYSLWGWGQTESTEQEMNATGTGIIMDASGYIITNAHVIYDNESQYNMGLAKKVQVVLNGDYYDGETQLEATIVGYDTAEDIAVLKVNTDQTLTVAEFGDSDDLRVGELVVAIGNPLGFDLFGSVTTGIVSALNREVTVNDSTMRLIQHDASINSGNSGGPLINSYGQVIGINSSKMSSSYYSGSTVEGLSFAIPMSHAKDVINDLINKGYVSGKPLIGISTIDVTEEQSQVYGIPVGVCIAEVNPGGAADLAGLKKSDIIIAVNGETVTTGAELNAVKDRFKAGDTITITAVRSGQDMTFSLTLQEKVPSSN